MAAASPLTDTAGPFGSLIQEKSSVLRQQPEQKPDEKPAPDAASPGVVERVRKAVGGARPAPLAPGEMPKFPEMQPLPPPPEREDTPPIEAWGSLAMLAAALGGMRSRNHATTALNAAGAALQGLHQKDEEKFKDEMERWKIATDNQQRMQTYEIETYKAIMGQQKTSFDEFTKLSRNEQLERMTELHAQSLALQNDRLTYLIEHQSYQDALKHMEDLEKANEKLRDQQIKIAHDYQEEQGKEKRAAEARESVHTMQSDFENAFKNLDPEAVKDPNAWKWKYYPKAAKEVDLPKTSKPAAPEPQPGLWDRLTGHGKPVAAPGPQSSAVPSTVYASGGKHYRYKGTGGYDHPDSWETTAA